MDGKDLLKKLAILAGGYAAGRIHQSVKENRSFGFRYDELEMFRQELLDAGASRSLPPKAGPNDYGTLLSKGGRREGPVPSDYDEKAKIVAKAFAKVSEEDEVEFLSTAEQVKNTHLMSYFYNFMSDNTPEEIVEFNQSLPEDKERAYWEFAKKLGFTGVDEYQEKINEIKRTYPGMHEHVLMLVDKLFELVNLRFGSDQFQKFMDLLGLLTEEEGVSLFNSFGEEHQAEKALAENKLLKAMFLEDAAEMKSYFKDLGWI